MVASATPALALSSSRRRVIIGFLPGSPLAGLSEPGGKLNTFERDDLMKTLLGKHRFTRLARNSMKRPWPR